MFVHLDSATGYLERVFRAELGLLLPGIMFVLTATGGVTGGASMLYSVCVQVS